MPEFGCADPFIVTDLVTLEMAETIWFQVAGTDTVPCGCGCGALLPTAGEVVAINPYGDEFDVTHWT